MPKPALDPEIRVLRSESCPSLSGRTTLTFEIGCKGDDAIHFRLSGNSSAGLFSDEWVAATDIQKGLSTGDKVSAASLQAVYVGKSANSGGFLLAVLKHLGLAEAVEGESRSYVRKESPDFIAEVQRLLQSDAGKAALGAGGGGRSKRVLRAPWVT